MDQPRDAKQEQIFELLAARFESPVTTPVLAAVLGWIHVGIGLWRLDRGALTTTQALFALRGPRLLTRFGAMKTARVDQGELWRLISSQFLHVNWLHLLLNLAGLFLVGRLVESFVGRTRTLALFLWSGAGGAATSWLYARTEVSVGASGGIYGLMGAALIFVLRHEDLLPPDIFRHLRRQLLIGIGINLPLGLLVPMVDQAAHVGGLISGAIAAMILGNPLEPAQNRAGGGQGPQPALTVLLAIGCAGILAAAVYGVRTTF